MVVYAFIFAAYAFGLVLSCTTVALFTYFVICGARWRFKAAAASLCASIILAWTLADFVEQVRHFPG